MRKSDRNFLIGFGLVIALFFGFLIWGGFRIASIDNKNEARCENAGGVWFNPRGDGICLESGVVVVP